MTIVNIGRNGLYGSVDIDQAQFPLHVQSFIYDYGLRQILNDTVSDKTDKDGNPLTAEQIMAKVNAKIEQLKAGELRMRGPAAEPVDPVEREAFRMAKEAITKQFKELKIWPTKGEDKFQQAVDKRCAAVRIDRLEANDYIEKWLAANPKVRKAAEKIVKEREGSGQVDLTEAGL